MKMRLTSKIYVNPCLRIGNALATGLLAAFTASASPTDETSFLARSFPEKVGSFARVLVKKNEAAIHGDVIDAAVAKYASGASEIEWSGTEFATPKQAFALESMMNSYEKEGAGISSVKNVAGKVRYAVIELPQGIVCCWVNKQRKDFFFVVSGKLPEIESFMRLQTTW
jgi:hypothetical protein